MSNEPLLYAGDKISLKLTDEQAEEFFEKVAENLKEWACLRVGQSMYNILAQISPDTAHSVLATDLDPFHIDSRVDAFLHHILSEESLQSYYTNHQHKFFK